MREYWSVSFMALTDTSHLAENRLETEFRSHPSEYRPSIFGLQPSIPPTFPALSCEIQKRQFLSNTMVEIRRLSYNSTGAYMYKQINVALLSDDRIRTSA